MLRPGLRTVPEDSGQPGDGGPIRTANAGWPVTRGLGHWVPAERDPLKDPLTACLEASSGLRA